MVKRVYDWFLIEEEKMDPYRDDFNTFIMGEISLLKEEVSGLKKEVRVLDCKRPVQQAIAKKINEFGWHTILIFLGICLGLAVIGWIGFSIYMASISDDVIDHCSYTHPGEEWTVKGNVNWGNDVRIGSNFKTLEEANQAAKINGCPNLPE